MSSFGLWVKQRFTLGTKNKTEETAGNQWVKIEKKTHYKASIEIDNLNTKNINRKCHLVENKLSELEQELGTIIKIKTRTSGPWRIADVELKEELDENTILNQWSIRIQKDDVKMP
ncbi:14387_t:CDS:2 [Entrophospora sp. SA101]|nr:14387_t:CDS:2 [Entrophospora sp. SA101]